MYHCRVFGVKCEETAPHLQLALIPFIAVLISMFMPLLLCPDLHLEVISICQMNYRLVK